MKINIQSLLKRISPVLCVLLILLTLVVPAIPAQAADTAIIEAGTYRFNDVLSAPSATLTQEVGYSVSTAVSGYDVVLQGEYIKPEVPSEGTVDVEFGFTSMAPDLGLTMPDAFYFYGNGDGWRVDTYGTGIQTITIPADSEVSSEFYEWFTANSVKVTEEEPTYLRIPIYSSSGDLIEAWVGEAPATFTVGENSLSAEFADYESYGREYEGDETFIGVRVDGSLYTPGDTFTLTEDKDVYFETKKALNVYDHDTGNLLFSANGQLPLWIDIHSKSLVVYYADKSVEYQSFVINKGLQISGISTALTYADPQYTVNQSVRFEDPADIYVYWTDTPVADPAPSLPETGPELIDPGSGDLWDDIFNDKLDINDYIDKLNQIETPLPNNFDFSMEHLFGGGFGNVSLLMSALVDEGFLPEIFYSITLFVFLAVVLFGSSR